MKRRKITKNNICYSKYPYPMANVDCHFYVEVFESEEDKDPIAISNIFKFPDDNPDSQVHTDAMDRYVGGMSDGLGVLPIYYRVFVVRGDGVKKFQYAGTVIADEEETEDEEVIAGTDSQGEAEPEVVDVESKDEPEKADEEEEPEQDDAEDVESKEPEQDAPEEESEEDESEDVESEDEEDVQEEEPEQDDAEDVESKEDEEDAPEEEPEEDESEDVQEEEPEQDDAEDVESKEDEEDAPEEESEDESEDEEEDEWPWLTELEGRPASKKNANKFMLGALMNYWMKPEVSWNNAETLAEDILEDPDDLWDILADKSDADIKALFTGPPALHRFLKMIPEMVREVAINVVKEYDGDSRKIWEDQDVSDILQRLHAVGVKKQTSALILWALRESGQIKI